MTFIRLLKVFLGHDRAELFGMYLILIKTARRCAYDLKHAAGEVGRPWKDEKEQREFWQQRASFWVQLFAPDGIKDYRHDLLRELSHLEHLVERYRDMCRQNKISPEFDKDFEEIPF